METETKQELGRYLKYPILYKSGSWLIVFDNKYNFLVFNKSWKGIVSDFEKGWLPSNNCDGKKHVEYYTSFKNALDGLTIILENGGKFKSR